MHNERRLVIATPKNLQLQPAPPSDVHVLRPCFAWALTFGSVERSSVPKTGLRGPTIAALSPCVPKQISQGRPSPLPKLPCYNAALKTAYNTCIKIDKCTCMYVCAYTRVRINTAFRRTSYQNLAQKTDQALCKQDEPRLRLRRSRSRPSSALSSSLHVTWNNQGLLEPILKPIRVH